MAIREQWELDGVVHRDEGPAVIFRHPETMAVMEEQYYVNGRLHRDPEPARIFYDEDGNENGAVWYRSGRRWIEGQDNWNRLFNPIYMPDGP
ncbi:MAG: hypothetical protein R3D99_00010 [Altererythrobacter sp.]